jgi:hypothetical protein
MFQGPKNSANYSEDKTGDKTSTDYDAKDCERKDDDIGDRTVSHDQDYRAHD